MKLDRDDIIKLRLSTDINFNYYIQAFRNFDMTAKDVHYYRAHTQHLGFIEENTISGFGFLYNGKRWSATHCFYQPWQWDNHETDSPLTYPWVLFFMGVDDTSFFKRFTSMELLEDYWNQLEVLNSLDDLTYFN